tara:strand:+ start:243 stop:530 length:288 start_codon:yes stop_codon:yes gene_type:complete
VIAMSYCHTAFQSVPPELVEELLSALTRECFVGGLKAYELSDGTYSIDAGENDIRAIYENENAKIKFLCRSKRDVGFYEKKLRSFAINHGVKINT